jgi:RNA-binding protein
LKILGTVLHTSSHKNLIVRGDKSNKAGNKKLFRINNLVFDRRKTKIGKVNDVFGPVYQPYFSVRVLKNVAGENLMGFKGKHVYVK